jgi:hypothetical protein
MIFSIVLADHDEWDEGEKSDKDRDDDGPDRHAISPLFAMLALGAPGGGSR